MIRTSMLVNTLVVLGLLGAACSKDENPAPRLSNLGDYCQSTGDCAGSYVCRQGQCAVSTVGITANKNVCQLMQCAKSEDCCPTPLPATTCERYADECEAGTTAYCSEYQRGCICDTTLNSCTDGQCVSNATCTSDATCASTSSTLRYCNISSGKCVACNEDTQCSSGYICADHACVAKCESRADCAAFYDCQSSHCALVGCANDRECKVASGAESACDAATKTCITPCANDAVCFTPGTPTRVSGSANEYYYRLCISGTCQSAGCNTDDECKALLQGNITSTKSSGYPHATAQCKTQ